MLKDLMFDTASAAARAQAYAVDRPATWLRLHLAEARATARCLVTVIRCSPQAAVRAAAMASLRKAREIAFMLAKALHLQADRPPH